MPAIFLGTLLSLLAVGVAAISPGPTALSLTLLGAVLAIWGTQRRA